MSVFRALLCSRYKCVLSLVVVSAMVWAFAPTYFEQREEAHNLRTDYQNEQGTAASRVVTNWEIQFGSAEHDGDTVSKDRRRTMEKIQKERRHRVKEYCSRAEAKAKTSYSIKGKLLAHFMIDTGHKIFMCPNYKAGSRHLHRLIGALNGANMSNEGFLPRNLFKWGNDFSPKEKLMMSKTYFRFFFTREPLVRLLSAFLDKFYRLRNPKYRLEYGRTIIATYRQNPSKESLQHGNDVKFSEFVQWVLDSPLRTLNGHWQLATIRCFPCAIEYDFIGRFENFQEDLADLFEAARFPNVSWELPFVSHNTTARVHRYYSQLSKQQILQLAELYRPDYEAFGYPFPGPLFKNLVRESM